MQHKTLTVIRFTMTLESFGGSLLRVLALKYNGSPVGKGSNPAEVLWVIKVENLPCKQILLFYNRCVRKVACADNSPIFYCA